MNPPGTRALVTGGAGFIGSHLTERLLAEGFQVRILDNFSNGRRENVTAVRDAAGSNARALDVLEGDLRSDADIASALKGVEVVFHLAALGSVERSIRDPLTSHEVNATGTIRLLLAARDAGVRRVLFAGSSSVYGENLALPKNEEMLTMPMSPYAASKRDGEIYCRLFQRLYGLETITLRYFNVFGPRQNPNSQYAAVIPLFIDRLMRNEPPLVQGDGEQTRDFTFVENVVEANVKAARAPAEKVSGRIFNIACGDRYSLNHLLDILRRETGRNIPATYCDPRPGDVRDSQADISLARSSFGYEPTVSFEEGLRRTVEYYRNTALPVSEAGA
jgi:nucleoside-diphosphate-sugar epimerase